MLNPHPSKEPKMTITQKQIDQELNTAITNGYKELLEMQPLEVAIDLTYYSPECEDLLPEELLPFVTDWQTRNR